MIVRAYQNYFHFEGFDSCSLDPFAGLSELLASGNAPVDAAGIFASSLVDLDGTILIHLVLFIIAFVGLKLFLFDPLRALFERRDEATVGVTADAENAQARADEAKRKYDVAMAEARAKAKQTYDSIVEEGSQEAQAIVEEAQTKAHTMVEQARSTIDNEVSSLMKELDASMPQIVDELSGKIVDSQTGANA